jgi:hypothetical protein
MGMIRLTIFLRISMISICSTKALVTYQMSCIIESWQKSWIYSTHHWHGKLDAIKRKTEPSSRAPGELPGPGRQTVGPSPWLHPNKPCARGAGPGYAKPGAQPTEISSTYLRSAFSHLHQGSPARGRLPSNAGSAIPRPPVGSARPDLERPRAVRGSANSICPIRWHRAT